MSYLVTGAAGFIGFHAARSLLDQGETVVGIDNLNDYYSTALKHDRLERLSAYPRFRFRKLDISTSPRSTTRSARKRSAA